MNLKYFFSLAILLGLYSCENRRSLSFETFILTTDMLSECRNEDCALVEINLLKTIEDHKIARAISKEIEGVACNILNTGKNESAETIQVAVSQFNSLYQSLIKKFPDEAVPYEATIDCKLLFQSKNLISVAIDSYVFAGGAHGYGGVSYLTIDSNTGKQLSNEMLFKDSDKFTNHVEKIFRTKNDIPENESINSTGYLFKNDVFSLPKNIGFTETQVILHYNPYEISSYADGFIELKFNKNDVASFFEVNIL